MNIRTAALALACLLCPALTGCVSTETKTVYADYTQALLDCTYHGVTEQYMELAKSTQEEADTIYQDQVEYVTEMIYYQYGIDPYYISDDTLAGCQSLAETLLDHVKYTVGDVETSDGTHYITVQCEPIIFWETTFPDVETFFKGEFGERYEAADTEEELEVLEEEYAVKVLEIANRYVSEITCGDPVESRLEISVDENGSCSIATQDWLNLGDVLLNPPAY